MKRIECPTCEGHGEVLVDDEGRLIVHSGQVGERETCEDCWGEGVISLPTLRDNVRTRLYRTPIGREVLHRKRQVDHARVLWRDRDAATIAAVVHTHKQTLADEPRLRGLVDHELLSQVGAAFTPLGWRGHDLRWATANAIRAIKGLAMLPLDYRETSEVRVSQEGDNLFERNMIAVVAERHRQPVKHVS